MVERIARTIEIAGFSDQLVIKEDNSWATAEDKARWRERAYNNARRVIEEILVPTKEMVKAGALVTVHDRPGPTFTIEKTIVKRVYAAMINSIREM